MSWGESPEEVADLKRRLGDAGWRLPNINVLEPLVDWDYADPALPAGHPVPEADDAYWRSTTRLSAPDPAWALYMSQVPRA